FIENEDAIFSIINHLAIPIDEEFETVQFNVYSYELPPGPIPGTFSDRFITVDELGILRRLLSVEFPGRDEIAREVEKAIVRRVDLSGSIEFSPFVKERHAENWIPSAAMANDIDGVTIRFLLQMIDGRARKLEILKDDRSSIKRMPSPSEL